MGGKEVAMTHVDQLLEEYLRVINSKDDEIHGLIRRLEERRCELKKKEDTYKMDVANAQQDLEKARRDIRKMSQKNKKYEETIDQLVKHNEAMKVSVTDMQQKLSEAEKSIEENRVLQRHELEEVRRQHRVEVQALQAERDKLKAEETCVHSEKVAAQRAVEACEAWEKELNEKEARHEELKRTVAELRREMESMVTAKKYMDALADCEESFRAQKTAAAAEIDDLNKRLSKAKQSVGKCQSELEELGATNAKLEKRLTEASREEEKVRQMLTAEQEMRKNLCASHQREMELAREANEKTTAKLTATVEQLQRGQTKVQTLEQQLTDVTEALERERRRGGEEREKMSSQLIAMQAKLTEHQLEAERRQRKLEDQSAELKEVHATLATTKEGSMHRTSELKEKLTHALTEKDHIREDRDRLIFELKDVQHQLSSLKERFSDEKRTLTTRLEDATITIDRMKDQLKEKEHQQQASSAAEEKRLQELTWLHRNELADSKRASENEVNDLRQRLNSTSVQLVEEVANSKAYQRELQAAHESVRRSHEECEQRVSEAREAAKTLEDVRRESMSLREELAKQKQMTEAALENGARLRRSLENMESESAAEAKRHESISVAFVDAKESLEATRSELAQLKRELAKAECEIHKKDSESSDLRLQESQKRIEQLERDIANMQQERQHHLASIEKLREVRESAEAMGRDAKEELQRLHAELQQKTTEYERVTQHAKDVEELAKRSSEELEREISRRDSTIGSMQQEILRLAEERTKVAVLEERLSHQADLSRRDVDALQNRISLLEKELDGRDVQLRDRITEAQEMAEQLRHFQNRVGELEETVMHKEKKHSLRKEALRKALEQVDAAAEKKAEAENILEKAKLSREKSTGVYKKEVERMQQEVREAREAQRAAELRLATQEEALAEMTKTAGINQTIHERHLSRMKEEQSSCFAKSADELNETLERINALAHDLGQTRKALREAEDAKQEALQYAKDAQRRMTTSYARLVSNMAEDALMTKEMFGDFAIAAITRSFYQLSKISHNGWDIAVSFGRQTSEEFAQERSKMQREMAQLKQSHTEELQAAAEERNKEMSKLALKHGFDIAKLRQEIVEVTEQSSRALDAVVKEHQHKEEQFQRDKTELERLRLEVAHREDQIAALREQLRGFEHRSEAERAALDQEKRTLQQQQERIRRRLDDCTMEQNQSEVEVRELRSELSAMQQVLQEKENVLASERERTRQESRRLTALTAAKETLHGQVEELRRQIQALQLQLSVARQGAQCRDHTAVTQQSRLEERVSELTKSLNAVELEKRRLGRQTHSDEKKIAALERELAESRKREAELSSQLQARKAENSALKERCANLESLKNIGEVTLAETRMREKDLLEKIEELRTAQQLMQLCFDKQQEQLEVGRRMHEQDVNRSGLLYKHHDR